MSRMAGWHPFMNQAQRVRLQSGFASMRNPKIKYNPKKEKGTFLGLRVYLSRGSSDGPITDVYGTVYRDGNNGGIVRVGEKMPRVPQRQR